VGIGNHMVLNYPYGTRAKEHFQVGTLRLNLNGRAALSLL